MSVKGIQINLFLLFTFLFVFSASDASLISIGYRDESHDFETVSRALTPEIEKSYDLFIFINTEESSKGPLDRILPSQYMLIVGKKANQDLIFKRDLNQVITGIDKQALRVNDILPDYIFDEAHYPKLKNRRLRPGFPFDWPVSGGSVEKIIPVSTGTDFSMPTFSGIFQINWGRSKDMLRTDSEYPMSYALYLGYNYHDKSIPQSEFSTKNSERVSYVAIHGTPKRNWSLLGRASSSIGCARSHPSINKELFKYIDNNLAMKNVIDLDWNQNLPTLNLDHSKTKLRKPVLIVTFKGYRTNESDFTKL